MSDKTSRIRLFLVAATLFVVAVSPLAAAEATLYRDRWGVPHIYAESRDAAAFAHGYAQAEDRLEDLLTAYLVATGKAASVFGPSRLETDMLARMAGHERISRERYGDLEPATRNHVEAFVAGVRKFMADRPEKVPEWAFEPEPHHVVALYRAFAYIWSYGQARGDLEEAGSVAPTDRGSNAWVVGPRRSALGGPIALIDPHLSWAPENRFYEAHVHGGDLDFFGFSVIGTPVMAVGHTDVFSLALTTGGPDCADIYEERIHPDDPLKYEYDGEWRSIEVEEVAIEVRTDDGMRTESLRVERTHHGPILKRDGTRAWAMRTAYDTEIGIVEQWFDMARARGLGEFINAMRRNQSLPQNVMYADVYGNTFYVRAGRVPIRPPGYPFDRPAPGWTSKTEWQGIHDFTDLVQVLNPPAGYMQNCNNSPDVMMPGSALTSDLYPASVYNVRPGRGNSRGRRALELLGNNANMDLEAALALAVDTQVDRADLWQRAAAGAFATHSEEYAHVGEAVRHLLTWDRRMDTDSNVAQLFRLWMKATRRKGADVPRGDVEKGEMLDAEGQRALLEALSIAVTQMQQWYGRLDVTWGEVNRVERGGKSWPAAGCRADGISTLRSVRFSSPNDEGISRARGGAICTTLVVLSEDGVSSYSVTPFGQTNDPASPHHTDQGEYLFSGSLLKPTWYDREDLLENVESKTVLRYSP